MSPPQQPSPAASGPRSGLRAWRERRHARRAERAAAHMLYRDLVARARDQRFYRDFGVPDTPEGRFEIVGLHAALLLRRLKSEGAAGRSLGQALFDLMFADMDASLRELGVGDLGVGRQVKRLAGQFYARLAALEQLLGPAEAGLLAPHLRANVWQGGPPPSPGQVGALADYLIASERHLAAQTPDALLGGRASFARLDG
jgi:cytochrome b pre-mRNA-processing protein 3